MVQLHLFGFRLGLTRHCACAQLEIVWNNGGYVSFTQEDAYYNVFADDEPADVLQTFMKAPGAGPPA